MMQRDTVKLTNIHCVFLIKDTFSQKVLLAIFTFVGGVGGKFTKESIFRVRTKEH